MSTYLIGDVQGCYEPLMRLLAHIDFNPAEDRLGFVGDLVNRGPDSLLVLRFLKSLSPAPMIVLGNHDLYCLVLGYELVAPDLYTHTLHALMKAPDKRILLDWLRAQPLIYPLPGDQGVLVHAGIPPQWSIPEAISQAAGVHAALKAPDFANFLSEMFGDLPTHPSDSKTRPDSLRYTINALTRMRYCSPEGRLTFERHSEKLASDEGPWFDYRCVSVDKRPVFFGHWAALEGHCSAVHCHALDTGCAWGRTLTALRLEDTQRFSVHA